ncbi:MAG: hypothetical protein QXI12_11950 [Candidatus Methanomethyliaceae archaeon]
MLRYEIFASGPSQFTVRLISQKGTEQQKLVVSLPGSYPSVEAATEAANKDCVNRGYSIKNTASFGSTEYGRLAKILIVNTKGEGGD